MSEMTNAQPIPNAQVIIDNLPPNGLVASQDLQLEMAAVDVSQQKLPTSLNLQRAGSAGIRLFWQLIHYIEPISKLVDLAMLRHLEVLAVRSMALRYLATIIQEQKQMARRSPATEPRKAALERRTLLLNTADLLWKNSSVIREKLQFIRKGRGSEDLAGDLMRLNDLYQSMPAEEYIGRSTITAELLEETQEMAEELFAVLPVGGKKLVAAELQTANIQLLQCWSLFNESYGQCRRMAFFTFWDDNTTSLIEKYPSVYAASRKRHSSKADKKNDTNTSTTSPDPNYTDIG
jgi:hypothetical protein